MKIYIASSWKNQHAVEMLTRILRDRGHDVASFVERADNLEEELKHGKLAFDDWVWSDSGKDKFKYDTENAITADLVIYIAPSGTDAWAEVGAAWGNDVPIVGLHAKGEQSGIMRRMVQWLNSVSELELLFDHIEKKGIEWLKAREG
jgi:hypothetical protein